MTEHDETEDAYYESFGVMMTITGAMGFDRDKLAGAMKAAIKRGKPLTEDEIAECEYPFEEGKAID